MPSPLGMISYKDSICEKGFAAYQATNTSTFQLIGEMDNSCRRAPKGCPLQRGLRALISDCIDRCSSTTKTEDRNLEGDISAGWISAASYKSAE
ncbi:hypothetical protein CDAR_246921 [Caerostris darwini]|uniref:Uncharacterized protein n=1 Tax=Caerostris darwini TaxID=1538125 RepID=A0AAV4X005_9ARAC|nr:hypothetical protein CDAR_246921 [Caerostris darwini]